MKAPRCQKWVIAYDSILKEARGRARQARNKGLIAGPCKSRLGGTGWGGDTGSIVYGGPATRSGMESEGNVDLKVNRADCF